MKTKFCGNICIYFPDLIVDCRRFPDPHNGQYRLLVPVIPIISLVLVPVIQFFSCALLDHGVLRVMLVMSSEIEFEA